MDDNQAETNAKIPGHDVYYQKYRERLLRIAWSTARKYNLPYDFVEEAVQQTYILFVFPKVGAAPCCDDNTAFRKMCRKLVDFMRYYCKKFPSPKPLLINFDGTVRIPAEPAVRDPDPVTARMVDQVLRSYPEEKRRFYFNLLKLRVDESRTIEECADVLGVPKATIHDRLKKFWRDLGFAGGEL